MVGILNNILSMLNFGGETKIRASERERVHKWGEMFRTGKARKLFGRSLEPYLHFSVQPFPADLLSFYLFEIIFTATFIPHYYSHLSVNWLIRCCSKFASHMTWKWPNINLA